MLFPEDRRLPRPFQPQDPYGDPPVGDYHPISVEFFLSQAELITSRLARWLGLRRSLWHRGETDPKGISISEIERLMGRSDGPEEPREAVLNLVEINSADPESAWERYFSLLEQQGVSTLARTRRLRRDPVPPTVYARVVQHGGPHVMEADPEREEAAPPARAVRALEKAAARVAPEAEFDAVWETVRPFGIRPPQRIRLRPSMTIDPDEIAIQYWFLYLYNDFINAHEGDWESVTIFLNRSRQPTAAAYASHDSGRRRDWSEVERRGERWDDSRASSTHPVVYVAAGSHGSYFAFPGPGVRYLSEVKARRRFRQYTIGLRLTAREALDRVPDPESEETSVRLGPSGLKLIHIPQRRGSRWAWLDHPRLYWGSRALSVPGRGGPQGPAWAHSPSDPNWRWHNPWYWAYATCEPDDLIFDPYVSPKVGRAWGGREAS